MQDRDLKCWDCGKTFVFSTSEQEFFKEKGLVNEPKRCPNCRLLMRMYRSGTDVKKTSEVACAECGATTRVPFQPKGHSPVFCITCFHEKKNESGSEEDDIGPKRGSSTG